MCLSNCKAARLLCYGDPHLLVLYSTMWARCSRRGAGHTVTQQQQIPGEAAGAVAQASRGRQASGGREQRLFWNKRAEFKAFQTALLWTAHHSVCSPDFAFLLRCVWFLKDQGKALAIRNVTELSSKLAEQCFALRHPQHLGHSESTLPMLQNMPSFMM